MANRFDTFAQNNSAEKFDAITAPIQAEKEYGDQPRGNRFEQMAMRNTPSSEEQEGWGKWFLRTAYQVPSGIAKAATFPLDLINAIGYYEAVDPETIDTIRRESEKSGIPFDEEAYIQAAQQHAMNFPTVSNIEREVEEKTGAPLQAKTELQKFISFASSAGKLASSGSTFRGLNTSLPKPILGAGVAATAEAAKALGVPEPIADIGSLLALKQPGAGAGKVSIGKKTKPSGLPERRYEALKEKKAVSEKTISRINEKVERDVREISNKIIEKTPIHETRKALQENHKFKQEAKEAFREVETVAENIPGTISTEAVKKQLVENILKKKGTGYAASEYDKKFKSEIYSMLKETPRQEIQAVDLVRQYRKNNSELSKVYEPGQSFSHNKAKRDAILEHNRAIAKVIENQYPNSDFSKLFKETNEKWASIMDVEAIDKFLNGLFDGKIDYSKAKNFFEKEGMNLPFKRALGNEGFVKFETLLGDLMSTEKATKLLKQAKSQGFTDIAETAGAYILHPTVGKAKLGWNALKGGYRKIYEMLLDKPQLAVTWDKGIKSFKAGDFKTAEKQFSRVREAEVLFDSKKKENVPQIAYQK